MLMGSPYVRQQQQQRKGRPMGVLARTSALPLNFGGIRVLRV